MALVRQKLQTQFYIQNLFNKSYQVMVNQPMPLANFQFTLNFKFNMKNNLLKWAMIALLMPFGSLWSQTSAKFEDISLAPNSFYNGSDFAGGFRSGDFTFTNEYDSSFGGFWSGFAVSNTKNDSTPGFLNQYSSITGGGRYSQNYGVFYGSGKIKVEGAAMEILPQDFYITNSTYAYFDMKNGSAFTKNLVEQVAMILTILL
jgi:hypothetical protein